MYCIGISVEYSPAKQLFNATSSSYLIQRSGIDLGIDILVSAIQNEGFTPRIVSALGVGRRPFKLNLIIALWISRGGLLLP